MINFAPYTPSTTAPMPAPQSSPGPNGTVNPPSAVPAIIVLTEIRCPACGKLACEASGIVKKRCDRCKTWFVVDTTLSKPRASFPSVP